MIERCSVCLGKKQIAGLGGIYKECSNCKGIGHIKIENMDAKHDVEWYRIPERPKRGRPRNA
jgi:hypothetical protein